MHVYYYFFFSIIKINIMSVLFMKAVRLKTSWWSVQYPRLGPERREKCSLCRGLFPQAPSAGSVAVGVASVVFVGFVVVGSCCCDCECCLCWLCFLASCFFFTLFLFVVAVVVVGALVDIIFVCSCFCRNCCVC